MARTDTASRVIRSTTSEIWAALVDPFAVVEWLPPHDMTGRIDEWDARPGGAYAMTLTYADDGHGKSTADSDAVSGRFVELVPGERFVQDVDFDSDDPAYAGTMRMSWLLRRVDDDTTEVVIRADGVPPGISPEDHADGLSSSLQNLAGYLADRT